MSLEGRFGGLLFPLRIGSDRQFESLKASLDEIGYTEAAVCERTGVRAIHQFRTLAEGRPRTAGIGDALDALIRLLMDGEVVERAELGRTLGEQPVQNLFDLGIVETASNGSIYAEVVLYPQRGLYIVSDRAHRPVIAPQALPDDVVYASITRNTARFLSLLPEDSCDAMLDLCSGTGIAALVGAARFARHAWACDLSRRATHFAEFNRRLNGLGNVTVLQGDLYAPVAGQTFDRIVAHPPYVPAAEEAKLLFRDGGKDGEQIVRGIVAGLPDHLRPGGRAYIVTAATDRKDEPLEQRVREWLGQPAPGFDVLFVLNEIQARPDQLLEPSDSPAARTYEPGPRTKLYDQLRVTALVHGMIVIERHGTPMKAVTARCMKSPQAAAEAVEWFRVWHGAVRRPQFRERLLEARLHPAPGFRLVVTHTFQQGVLTPKEFRLRSDYPFRSDARSEAWVALLAGACDGSRTGLEVLRYLKEQEAVSPEFASNDFAEVLERLAEGGFLEIEGYELPVPPRISPG